MKPVNLLLPLLTFILIFESLNTFSQEQPKPRKCKLRTEIDKKAGIAQFRSNSFGWLKFRKTIQKSDTSYQFLLLMSVDFIGMSTDLTITFTDGSVLKRQNVPIENTVATNANGTLAYTYTALQMDTELIAALRSRSILECQAGKETKRKVTEKQALKLQNDLECVLDAQ